MNLQKNGTNKNRTVQDLMHRKDNKRVSHVQVFLNAFFIERSRIKLQSTRQQNIIWKNIQGISDVYFCHSVVTMSGS